MRQQNRERFDSLDSKSSNSRQRRRIRVRAGIQALGAHPSKSKSTLPIIETTPINKLKPSKRNPRTHSKVQIEQIAQSIKNFGFLVPIVVDAELNILSGYGRWAAARTLKLTDVPVVRVEHLSEAKRRAFALADNKIAANAGWDRKLLAAELPELGELLIAERLDICITGFSPVEIDHLAVDFENRSCDPADEISQNCLSEISVSRRGDSWRLGRHNLLCGDARDLEKTESFMNGSRAAMAFLDPPYNMPVKSIVGRGRIKHDEFAMGSGEMSPKEFAEFLDVSLRVAAQVSFDGAVHYVCMDWRHIAQLIKAGRQIYGAMLNLAVWVKSNAGQGSFYRSQHEFVGVFRVGRTTHLNNIELGRHGRNRSNVWNYPGLNTFRSGRLKELRSHPTVKPISLIADCMKDCTRRGDVILDTFSGSGSTLLAAERIGRRAFAVEIEPRYIDLTIRRWQEFTGKDAIHVETGLTFGELAKKRQQGQ